MPTEDQGTSPGSLKGELARRSAGDSRASRCRIRVRARRTRSLHARSRVRIFLVEGLVLEQRIRQGIELAPILFEQRDDLLVGLVDDAAHLVVDELLGRR